MTSKISKKEIADFYKDYYDKLYAICPIEKFELETPKGETLHFFRSHTDIEDSDLILFSERDAAYEDFFEEDKARQLAGEDVDIGSLYSSFKTKSYIVIRTTEKIFDFGVEWDWQYKDRGITIYNNHLDILDKLGIKDGDKYELRVSNNPDHDFFKRLTSKRLVERAEREVNLEDAKSLIEDFGNHPHALRLSEVNTIVDYAIRSGVDKSKIAEAINKNGFNISYSTINSNPHFIREVLDTFTSFNISGLNPNRMERHFIDNMSFGFMSLLGDIDKSEITILFENIKESCIKKYEKRKKENRCYNYDINKFGVIGFLIVYWDYFGLFVKHLPEETQKEITDIAMDMFERADPEHSHSLRFNIDTCSSHVLTMFRDAGLMNKDIFIRLYQKALNRNYSFDDFNDVAYYLVDYSERHAAVKEIEENIFCPAPKYGWQKRNQYGHRIPKIIIPESLKEKKSLRRLIKDEVIKQGIAKETKIITDMTGITEQGKIIKVDNVKDWLFGVPGAHGNMQMMGTNAIAFPPQTPTIVTDIVKKAILSLAE